MPKLNFVSKKPDFFLGQKRIFNFLNLDSLWQFENNKLYHKEILSKNNINFPDGRMIGRNLRIEQVRGPAFMRKFLERKRNNEEKHFFIGKAEIAEIVDKTSLKWNQIKIYNPPYVKGSAFGNMEIKKIADKLERFGANFIWVGVGSPKQEILSNQLYSKYQADYFNVGAAFDFLIGSKKESPLLIRRIGLEWLYQLVIHPTRAWNKVKRHLIAMRYLNLLGVKK